MLTSAPSAATDGNPFAVPPVRAVALPVTPTAASPLADWLAYISAQHPVEIDMGLTRVQAVYARMGVAFSCAKVLVGGTNGKGSTCALLERIYHEAGYRVGKYGSPHLLAYNERVRIGLHNASDSALAQAFAVVEQARQGSAALDETMIALTYFEFGTLAAYWLFAQSDLDIAIIEVGLGGRLDATNIILPDVSVVVTVDLDHQAFLGDTREQIGWEKAHIYRTDKPAICADPNPPEALLAHAHQLGAKVLRLGHEFGYRTVETGPGAVASANQWQFFGPHGARHSLPFPALRGSYQLLNASAALAAVDQLIERFPVSQGELKRALLAVELPGRLQILPGKPTLILDVAHNPQAARVLDNALMTMGFFQHTAAVFAMMSDKAIADVARTLAGRIDHWHITALPIPRAASTLQLTAALQLVGVSAGQITSHASAKAALLAAQTALGPNDRLVVFGTFPLVAEALTAFTVL